MKVKKRNGRIQEFNLDKIKFSIQRASDDMNKPLNESDSNRIVNTINAELLAKNKATIEYREIHSKVVEILNEFGFKDLANFYNRGKC